MSPERIRLEAVRIAFKLASGGGVDSGLRIAEKIAGFVLTGATDPVTLKRILEALKNGDHLGEEQP